MTREEVIKILEILHQRMDYPTKEALAIAIRHLSQPSLPSNLDEAAEEYEHNLGYYECMNQWPSVAFKAGAEWMAGQGVTVKGLLYGGSIGIPDIPEEFYTDKEEEVIVQIRKK